MDRTLLIQQIEEALSLQHQLRLAYRSLARVIEITISNILRRSSEIDLTSSEKRKLRRLCRQLKAVMKHRPLKSATILEVWIILQSIRDELRPTLLPSDEE